MCLERHTTRDENRLSPQSSVLATPQFYFHQGLPQLPQTKVISVISGKAPMRIGGPLVPRPRLT